MALYWARRCGALLILCLLPAAALPQEVKSPRRGFAPGGSYHVSDFETVNTASANLMLRIPLASLPPGRGGLSAGISLRYNSKLWDAHSGLFVPGPNSSAEFTALKLSGDGGWGYGMAYALEQEVRPGLGPQPCGSMDPTAADDHFFYRYKIKVTAPDGAAHVFYPVGYHIPFGDGYSNVDLDGKQLTYQVGSTNGGGFQQCEFRENYVSTAGMAYYTTDGTYLRLEVAHDGDGDWTNNAWTLTFPNGTRVKGNVGLPDGSRVQRVYDANDNFVEIGNNSVSDQFGRTISVGPGAAPNEDYVTAAGFGGAPLRWTVRWKNIWVRRQYNSSDTNSATGGSPTTLQWSVRVVDQVILPAEAGGLSYSFTYNAQDYSAALSADANYFSHGWGEVASVTTPSGARSEYAYRLDGTQPVPLWEDVLINGPKKKELIYHAAYDGVSSEVKESWEYSYLISNYSIEGCDVKGPDGGVSSEREDQRGNLAYFSGPDGTAVEKVWKDNSANNCHTGGSALPTCNPYVKTEFHSVRGAGGSFALTAITDYTYDKNGNLTQRVDYDWVNYGAVQRDANNRPTGVIPATAQVKRVTASGYYNQTPEASVTPSSDPNAYYRVAGTPRRLNAVRWGEVRDAEGTLSRGEFTYDDPAGRGNLTEQRNWDSTKGALLGTPQDPVRLGADNSIAVRQEYDDNTTNAALRYGNVTLAVDANGNKTKYTYGVVTAPGGGTFTGLYPTTVVTAEGTGVQRTASSIYEFSTGLATKATDEDNQVSTSTTYDALGRPKLVKEAEGEVDDNNVSLERRTVTEYSDALRRVIVRSDLNSTGDEKLVSVQHYDELGRVRLSRTLEDSSTQLATDEDAGIKVQTRYSYSGTNSYTLVSSPYRAAASSAAGVEPTMGWALMTSDQGGRVVRAETFGGAALPAPFAASNPNTSSTGAVLSAYDANTVTVTDQAGRRRRSVADALGRLVRVDEPDKSSGALDDASGNPVQPTSYAYDAPGNLRRVDQGGQQRSFLYDSLGRLIRAKNPEQGSMAADSDFPALTDPAFGNPGGQWSTGYLYDPGGNLKKRKDARGVTTTYGYDGLSRNTSVTYAVPSGMAQTPAVTRTYDGATRGKGRLWTSESAQTGRVTVEGYDAAGRPLRQGQQFRAGGAWGTAYTVSYSYDLAGNLKTQTYPSGRSVSYSYDDAGRLSTFTGNLGGGAARSYADSFTYDAAGRRRQERYGTNTPVYNKHLFNTRGQLAEIRVSTHAITSADPGLRTNWNRGAIINHYSVSGGGASGGGTDNNGNLRAQEVLIPKIDGAGYDQAGNHDVLTQSFDYDWLNRLKRAEEASGGQTRWAQAYEYDRWGNRTLDAAGTWLGQPSAPPSELVNEKQFDGSDLQNTNRLYAPGDIARPEAQRLMRYDAAGNLVHDDHTGAGARVYDGENRMTAAVDRDGVLTSYVYDGDGRRVKRKADTAGEVWQVYGAGGELLAEYAKDASPNQPQKEYGYRGGELLVTAEAASADWGPPPGFTGPDPLSKGDPIKVEHLTELRGAVNQLRQHAGLSPYTFTVDPNPSRNVTSVKAEHIRQLRAALEAARSHLGMSIGGYAHPTLTENSSLIYAIDFQELRDQIRGAWQSGTGGVDLRWLVSDHLGTPRMVVDRTGSLAAIRRHDYLPFGEELFGSTGGRTPAQGYGAADNVRQKFTGKERDAKTGLDYFLARYYASSQGRFTSPDEFQGGARELYILGSGHPEKQALPYADLNNPQSLNKYQYCLNNPLRYIDPDGHQESIAVHGWHIAYTAGGAAVITLKIVGTTAAVGGGAPVLAAAAVAVTVTAAGAATYYLLLKDLPSRQNNTATNRSQMRPDIAPPNLPNASVNANINPNIFTRQQDTLKKAAGQVGYALAHIGYLQSGKPNCPPGSECYDRNKDHWRDEINGAVRKLERYLKRLKGTAKENLEKTIEQIKNDAGI